MFYLSDILDKYQIFLFFLYQNVYQFLRSSYTHINFTFIVLLIFMGIFTVLTPCFISMFPILITYTSSNTDKALSKIFIVFGVISSIFFTFLLSNFVSFYSFFDKLPLLSSLALVFVSLNLMQFFNFSFIPQIVYERLHIANVFDINWQSYLAGVLIGFGSTPCNTSIILLLTFLLKNTHNILFLCFYLFTYLLGSCMVLVFFVSFSKLDKNLYYLVWFLDSIFPLSGSLLLIFSLLLFLRKSFL
uniref:Thiol:disulfide interchange protein n=1 Tax=Palisada sp. TaxID=1955416 RepID=A0A1Z1MS20_9FLOR|nr:thiol:disulfide interchange protein [Palisada sp.]